MKILRRLNELNKIVIGYTLGKTMGLFTNGEVYLISERENEAEDNGYYLHKYIRENYPEAEAYYVINKKSPSYKRVKDLGNIVAYDSLKHHIYYFLSKKHISAFQFFGVPNNPLIWFLESKGFFKKKRIFLQHGITKELISSLKYSNTKYDMFICGAKPEYEYIKKHFQYPLKNVIYTGFSRYDGLHEDIKSKKQILLMPTWRQWLGMSGQVKNKNEDYLKLINSNYYKRYNSLINSLELEKILENENYELLFYLHPEAQRFREYFNSKNSRVRIVSREEGMLQDLIKESEVLITDYSSIAFDFAYMKKSILYYQFDSEEYYENHYARGYFDYERDGFGRVLTEELSLIESLKELVKSRKMNKVYEKRAKNFFQIYDTQNSKRIYENIKKI